MTKSKSKDKRVFLGENDNIREKVFCIGMNKTGTTSLNHFMQMHGYRCGDQASSELLITDYANNNWHSIIDFCNSADFFQDLPFSAPNTLDQLVTHFPNAKFILSTRANAEKWYASLTSFHKKVFGKGIRIPTKKDLQEATYRYKGFAWDANRALYPSPESDPYKKDVLMSVYDAHTMHVQNVFEGKSNLLTINIEAENAAAKLAKFLQIELKTAKMPWLNKTADF